MAKTPDNTYVVLLAGGSGTRLWPASTQEHPKQFSHLFGPQSLFQNTLQRIKNIVPLDHIYVITNAAYIRDILRQEPLLSEQNIIAEPARKNTALAMGVASAYIHKIDKDAVVINLATDHMIKDLDRYRETLIAAAEFAGKNKCLVTIGITPEYPHTGYGHIKKGVESGKIDEFVFYTTDGFKEKPDMDTAKEFTKSGNYLWNANNYVWHVQTVFDEFQKHAPDLFSNIEAIEKSLGTPEEKYVLAEEYLKAREVAIDYAIAEKTDKLFMLAGDFGWNDVGDWKVVHDLAVKDENGNFINLPSDRSASVQVDIKNCLIHAESKLVAVAGVSDLIIVDTPDALLVCHKEHAQQVKDVVKMLDTDGLKKYL